MEGTRSSEPISETEKLKSIISATPSRSIPTMRKFSWNPSRIIIQNYVKVETFTSLTAPDLTVLNMTYDSDHTLAITPLYSKV